MNIFIFHMRNTFDCMPWPYAIFSFNCSGYISLLVNIRNEHAIIHVLTYGSWNWLRFLVLKPTELFSAYSGIVRFNILNAWPWTVVCNMIEECHALCVLNTSLIDFWKEYSHCSCNKILHLWSLPNLQCFYSGVKSRWLGWTISWLVLVLNITQILLAGS